MKNLKQWLYKKRWLVGIVLSLVLASLTGYYYFFVKKVAVTDTYAVVETVARGTVSSGIVTSGTIVAAQKLSLDVYKQSRRIEAVNVKNAGHVAKGTVLYSFDKSGVYVNIKSSKVDIAQAELDLATAQATYSDPNTTLRTLQNNLVTLRTDIVDAEKDLVAARRTFFNANIGFEPAHSATKDTERPTISGIYNGTADGTYRISIYSSAAASGFSYRVTGLETDVQSVLSNVATPLGHAGLKVSFPSDVQNGDQWIVAVPNTFAPEYIKNKETYDTTVRTLNEKITSTNVAIANAEVDIKKQSQTDAVPYRNLDISKAEAKLGAVRQQLSEQYDVVKEQDIVAPFAGTVEGIENVVVGAIPTGATNDSISLGTLISDEFLVNFSLNAVDVAKVKVGQKVIVKVTSFPGVEPLEASITQISSLPESTGVAQYAVQALLKRSASTTMVLREGLLADVEVVDREVPNILRVPLSALSYEGSQAFVQKVGALTQEQQADLEKLGVIKSVAGTFPSYKVAVTVGVRGSFYVEITNGLKEGDQIIVTNTEADTAVVKQNDFGPGERRTSNSESDDSTQNANTNDAP